ncbi:MAG TPA: DUF255 domain-containing protein [Chthoniobacteraceae bacterium]
MSARIWLPALLSIALSLKATAEEKAAAIKWETWSDKIFERARAEHRFVLLDLGAGWCHWCHVMDEITYADPKVIELIKSKYLAVKVDQDSRPDLANRYEDYGWPATIVFNVDGSEIVKRQGYIPPNPMASMLQAIIDDPSPGPSVQPEPTVVASADAALSVEQREAAKKEFLAAYDSTRGGWGDVHKYLDWTALEYCLTEGAGGDARMDAMARQTLTAGLALIDPAWGGVYQYSTDNDWVHPHFEKIMSFQAGNLRLFSLAASVWNEPKWLDSAQSIHRYLRDFLLSPDGAFRASQDADVVDGEYAEKYFALDDAARRKLGIPRIDGHLYTRENGLAITGLCALYAASGDASALTEARAAANWALAHRSLADGGFRHDEADSAGPFLADNLAMAQAFLALYAATAERPWLSRAYEAAAFIDVHFRAPIGFATAAAPMPTALPPKPQTDENISIARFCRLLSFYTGNKSFEAMAQHGMRYLASPVVVQSQGSGTSGILLADREMRSEPLHVTIVGGKQDLSAQALFNVALRGAPAFARIEWYDPKEGPLPNADVDYPTGAKAQAFLCSGNACSAPMSAPQDFAKKLTATVHKTRLP